MNTNEIFFEWNFPTKIPDLILSPPQGFNTMIDTNLDSCDSLYNNRDSNPESDDSSPESDDSLDTQMLSISAPTMSISAPTLLSTSAPTESSMPPILSKKKHFHDDNCCKDIDKYKNSYSNDKYWKQRGYDYGYYQHKQYYNNNNHNGQNHNHNNSHFQKERERKSVNSYGIIAVQINCKNAMKLWHNLALFEYNETLDPDEKVLLDDSVNKGFLKIDDGKNVYRPPQFKLLSMLEHFKPFNLNFLLIQRKHSIDYEVFIRGGYKYEKLPFHITRMSNIEIDRIIENENDFDMLWANLWHNPDNKNYQHEKNKAKQRFETLNISELFYDVVPAYTHPSWGFPKGRRHSKETDRECAIREFIEETNVPRDKFRVLNLSQFFEKYIGSNDQKYAHKYYLAVLHPNLEEPYINESNKNQVTEIGDIGLFNFKDALDKFRGYHTEKRKVLKSANKILNPFQ